MFPQNNNKSGNRNRRPLFNMYWMYGLIALSLFALYYFQDGSQVKEVDWTDFEKAAVVIKKLISIKEIEISEKKIHCQFLI